MREFRLLLTSSVLSCFLVGCAIPMTHWNIAQWPITNRASYFSEPAPFRVAVLPLEDQRPLEERSGHRPVGLFLLLWNRRAGDYVTSDRAFGGNVNTQLTDQLRAYLRSSNVFVELVPAQTPPLQHPDQLGALSVVAIGRSEVADYVLGGVIEHFYGSQHQEASAFFLPLTLLAHSAIKTPNHCLGARRRSSLCSTEAGVEILSGASDWKTRARSHVKHRP